MFNIRDIAISIGFVIFIPLALVYGISTFMKRPVYPDYREVYRLEKKLHILKKEGLNEEIKKIKRNLEETNKEFESIRKKLELKQKELARKVSVEEIESIKAQLDQVKKENQVRELQYKKNTAQYDFNAMVVALIVGMIAFLFGMLIVESLGTGFIFGGAVCIIYGLLYYWARFSDITRFSILLGILLLLCAIGYLRFLCSRKHVV